jgi:hypothetical protein
MFHVEVGDSLAEVERRLIEQTLQCCRTRDEAARLLGISTKTLYNKLRLYGSGRPARLPAHGPGVTPDFGAGMNGGSLDRGPPG